MKSTLDEKTPVDGHQSSSGWPSLLLALAALFWAGNFIAGRALRGDVSPVELGFWRWTIAVLVLLPLYHRALRQHWTALRDNAALVVALGATGLAGFHTLTYVALSNTTALNAVLLLSLTPILILALTWCLRDEPVSVIRLAGALVSLVGAGVIVCRGDMAQALATRINAGDGVMAMALPLWAVYSVLLGRRPQSLPTPVLLMGSAVVAVVVLAPFLAWQLLAGPPMHLNAGSLAGILYMGVFASAGAFLCFNHGVGMVGAARAGPYLHLIPVFGTMLAVVLLGEPLHPYHGVGATLVCAGILLAGRRRLPVIHARPHAAGGRPGWTKSTRPPTHPTVVRR